MFAVIKTGGKQYRVAKDDVIRVEKLDAEQGATVNFDEILMVGEGAETTVGAPTVANASVAAEVLEQARNDKVVIFKKKRRQNYRRKKGHRQDVTVLKITDISTGAAKKAAPKAEKKAEKAAEPAPEAAPETPESEG